MARVEEGIFTRRTENGRGPMLLIFRADQADFPEEKQKPSITVELDGEVSQYVWGSQEPVSEAMAKASRTLGRHRSLDWEPLGSEGFTGPVDNMLLTYEGNHGQKWIPRFSCTVGEGTPPIEPLAQLIASTVFGRGFPQRTLVDLISAFLRQPEPSVVQ